MRNRWENILKEDFISNSKWLVMNCTVDEYINQAWTIKFLWLVAVLILWKIYKFVVWKITSSKVQ